MQRVCSSLYLFPSWQNVSFNVFPLELLLKKYYFFHWPRKRQWRNFSTRAWVLLRRAGFDVFQCHFRAFVVCSNCWLGKKSLTMRWEKELINFSQQHSRTPVNVSISYIFIHLGNKMHSATVCFLGTPALALVRIKNAHWNCIYSAGMEQLSFTWLE